MVSYETGRQSVTQLAHALKASPTTIYKWIDKYSTLAPEGIRIVEEKDAEAQRIRELEADLTRARATVARQAIRLDYHDVLHDYLRAELGVDAKKAKSDCRASPTSATASALKTPTP